jgi:hypothetical protein
MWLRYSGSLPPLLISMLSTNNSFYIHIYTALGIVKYKANSFATVFSTLKSIHIEEGMSGLYRGMSATLVTVPLFWACYWTTYEHMKRYLLDENDDTINGSSSSSGGSSSKSSKAVSHMLAAMTAGALGDIITNPLWVIRTRTQTLVMVREKWSGVEWIGCVL